MDLLRDHQSINPVVVRATFKPPERIFSTLAPVFTTSTKVRVAAELTTGESENPRQQVHLYTKIFVQ